ncbi:DUF4199 domain-containing protein [Ascidiimonas sp. W6]|uniref:DUF4199 domain-containing protein n=1 Tax=Ascidiimonas meishanensis TaxID=3128903 RepID=UPI0030EE65AE
MNAKKIHIRYGIIVAIVLIFYFLFVRLFNLHENPWLRLLNGGIVAYGIYAAIRLRRLLEGKEFKYFNGFKTGLYTGFLATLIFVGFMSIYMFHLDPEFPIRIMDTWMKDYNQGPGILIFVLTIEGLASSLVLTLAFMQKFKPSWNTTKKPIIET